MATKQDKQTYHDDAAPARSKSPNWVPARLAAAKGVILPFRTRPGFPGHTGSASRSPGSKRGYVHISPPPHLDPANRRAHAAAWSAHTGRPLPPHMRTRTQPVKTPARVSQADRTARYGEPLTPAQRRRVAHKARLGAEARAAL